MTKEERVELYRSFLAEEGFQPKIDRDGDVAFKFEGGGYAIIVEEKDDEFFRLVYPNFWSIDSDEERAKATEAAMKATMETKVAKVFIVRDDTWATIELFLPNPEDFKPVFRRALSALRAGVMNFRNAMRD